MQHLKYQNNHVLSHLLFIAKNLQIMKHLLIIIFIFSGLFARAEWVKGTIILNNGREKQGYIKYFSKVDKKTIQFRSQEKGKTTSFKSKDLSEVRFEIDKDETRIFKNLHLKRENLKGKSHTSKAKSWYGVVYRGDFDVVGVSTSGSMNSTNYYINWPGEKTASLIFVDGHHNTFVIGGKAFLKKSSRVIFKGKCDLIVTAIEDESFQPKTIKDIIGFYEKNCAGLVE